MTSALIDACGPTNETETWLRCGTSAWLPVLHVESYGPDEALRVSVCYGKNSAGMLNGDMPLCGCEFSQRPIGAGPLEPSCAA